MKKNAFTLAETLIVLIVIGIIAALTIAAFKGQPDKEKVMFKKAYTLTERAVTELVNDDSLYPYDPDNVGFYNVSKQCIDGDNTKCYGGGGMSGVNYTGRASKFCRLFVEKFEIIGDPTFSTNSCTFTTSDNMDWTIESNFNDGTTKKAKRLIKVDVNGGNDRTRNKPNYTLSSNQPDANNKITNLELPADTNSSLYKDLTHPDRDIFYIIVSYDGRVTVPVNSQEEAFLKTSTVGFDK